MVWVKSHPGARKGSGSKYHNKKVQSADGETFDSRREYRRYMDLKTLERVGVVKDLRRQVPYIIVPEHREPDTTGPRGGRRKGRVIETAARYIADFVYVEKNRDGTWQQVVEDCKGMRTDTYKLKRKLMYHVHGIRIRET